MIESLYIVSVSIYQVYIKFQKGIFKASYDIYIYIHIIIYIYTSSYMFQLLPFMNIPNVVNVWCDLINSVN